MHWWLLLLLLITMPWASLATTQESLDRAILKAKSYELGQAILFFMPDRQQTRIGWDHRANSAIRWLDSPYISEKRPNGGEVFIRRGLLRVNVQGKLSTVLRQRKQELWWTVRLQTLQGPHLGVQEIGLEPGTPSEPCFGHLYTGCAFKALPSLSAAGITWKEVCKSNQFGDQQLGYLLSHPLRAKTQVAISTSGGSGGRATWITLRLEGDPKELCKAAS